MPAASSFLKAPPARVVVGVTPSPERKHSGASPAGGLSWRAPLPCEASSLKGTAGSGVKEVKKAPTGKQVEAKVVAKVAAQRTSDPAKPRTPRAAPKDPASSRKAKAAAGGMSPAKLAVTLAPAVLASSPAKPPAATPAAKPAAKEPEARARPAASPYAAPASPAPRARAPVAMISPETPPTGGNGGSPGQSPFRGPGGSEVCACVPLVRPLS